MYSTPPELSVHGLASQRWVVTWLQGARIERGTEAGFIFGVEDSLKLSVVVQGIFPCLPSQGVVYIVKLTREMLDLSWLYVPGTASNNGNSGDTSVSQRPIRRPKEVIQRPSSGPSAASHDSSPCLMWHTRSCTTWSHGGQSRSRGPPHPSAKSSSSLGWLARTALESSSTFQGPHIVGCGP